MRKIENSELLKQKFKDYTIGLFENRDFPHPKDALAALLIDERAVLYNLTEKQIDDYINKIIDQYDEIILADQTKMLELIAEFEIIIPAKKIKKKFSEDIVDAMRYNALREKEFIKLVQEIGIKTCVYCHAQLTVVMNKKYYERNFKDLGVNKGDVRVLRGLLELDHRHPKSKYPFLSTCVYNLYPVCGNCNRVKSKSDSNFDLYTDSDDLEVFSFSVNKTSAIDCMILKDSSLIKIDINSINISDKDSQDYLEMFDIKEIYDTQKDIVEELLHKKVVYNDKYKKELHDEFRSLFPNQSMIDRLIIGNYDQPNDIYKRPMAKFVQDIARDIELIKPLPKKLKS